MNFSIAYGIVKRLFDVRIKSKLAIIFEYKDFEISLFSNGRMLIKNVKDEESALKVYRDIRKKIESG